MMQTKRILGYMIVIAMALLQAQAQQVTDTKASYVNVTERRAFLSYTTIPVLLQAIAALPSCVASKDVAAPLGHVVVPSHYINGYNGAINPAEADVVKPYLAFQARVTAGMNQYVAKDDETEANCALNQLDEWAQAKALLDYDAKESSQAWYTMSWTLCAAATSMSVLVQDPKLDAVQQKRVIGWLDAVAHKVVSFETPNQTNNLRYWRAAAAIATGVVAKDDELFHVGIDVYKTAIGQMDEHGAFPLEMARKERAIHYQFFALQPLVVIAEFAEHQGVPLYTFTSHGRILRDAILFLGKVVDDPKIVKQYTPDEQMTNFEDDDFAPFQFYVSRFGSEGLGMGLMKGLAKPTTAVRIGGNTTVLTAK